MEELHAETPTSISTESESLDRVIPREGWHVLHLFYRIEHSQWDLYSDDEKRSAKVALTELAQEIRSSDNTQLLTFSMVTPKSDLGFMLLTDDLHKANEFEKKLTLSLGADVLHPSYSYLSITERGEEEEENHDQLYPKMPDSQVFCFYPMGIRRGKKRSWYDLDSEERRVLLSEHIKEAETYSESIFQLVTGSSGLDEMEWGVTLFSQNTQDIKDFVYEMRFNRMNARYTEFGEINIGLQLPLDELFRRLAI